MAKKTTNYYFDTFIKAVSCANEAAHYLKSCCENFCPDTLPTNLEEMHKIEHSADGIKNDMLMQLAKEFLPPIEREDIVELANTIDVVTDRIEDVLLRTYMFNLTSLRADTGRFVDVIVSCCNALSAMLEELPNFRKSTILRERIIEINTLEEEGDRLYSSAVRSLYTEGADPITILTWTTMYDLLEKCCDSCEHVAEMVERIVVKNS